METESSGRSSGPACGGAARSAPHMPAVPDSIPARPGQEPSRKVYYAQAAALRFLHNRGPVAVFTNPPAFSQAKISRQRNYFLASSRLRDHRGQTSRPPARGPAEDRYVADVGCVDRSQGFQSRRGPIASEGEGARCGVLQVIEAVVTSAFSTRCSSPTPPRKPRHRNRKTHHEDSRSDFAQALDGDIRANAF